MSPTAFLLLQYYNYKNARVCMNYSEGLHFHYSGLISCQIGVISGQHDVVVACFHMSAWYLIVASPMFSKRY